VLGVYCNMRALEHSNVETVSDSERLPPAQGIQGGHVSFSTLGVVLIVIQQAGALSSTPTSRRSLSDSPQGPQRRAHRPDVSNRDGLPILV
jgi:hypothetical protein